MSALYGSKPSDVQAPSEQLAPGEKRFSEEKNTNGGQKSDPIFDAIKAG